MKMNRGFTLIETLAVIFIGMALIGVVALGVTRYRQASTVSAFVADMDQLTSSLKNHYKARLDYAGLTTRYAQNNQLIPLGLRDGTSWGSAITVVATDIADVARAGDVATPNSGFAISWTMPLDVCSSVIPALLPRVRWLLAGEEVLQRPGASAAANVQTIRQACAPNRLGGSGKGLDGPVIGGEPPPIDPGGIGIEPFPIDPGPPETTQVVFTLKDG